MPFPFPFTLYGANRASNTPSDVTCDFTYCYGGDWVQGKVGNYGLEFDGTDDHVVLPLGSTLSGSGTAQSGTVACWVKLANVSGYKTPFGVSKGSTNTDAFMWQMNSNYYEIAWKVGGSYTTTARRATSGGPNGDGTFNAGEWIHIGLTSDGTAQQLYMNGTASTMTGGSIVGTWFGDFGSDLTDIWLGGLKYNNVQIYPFSGTIDEFGIWDVALTDAQMSALYNNGDGARADSITPPAASDGDWSTGTNKKIGTYGIGEFDGSTDYVSASWDSQIDFGGTDSFSWSIWLKASALPTYSGIISKESTPKGEGWYLYLHLDKVVFAAFTGVAFSDYIQINTPSAIVAGSNWYHIVATYGGTNNASGMKIYIDGNLIIPASSVDDGPLLPTVKGHPLSLGTRGAAPNQPFEGYMDDFAVYDVELDAGAVTDLYNSGSANIGALASNVSSSALKGYWDFENPGPGSTTISGSRGLNATMMGGLTGGATGSLLTYYDFEIGDSQPGASNFPPVTSVYDNMDASFHSPTAHTGTMTNMSVADFGSWAQGKVGKYSLDFDGTNDYVTVPTATDIEFGDSDDFTVACWAKPNLPASDFLGIVGKETAGGAGYPGWAIGYWNWTDANDNKFTVTIGNSATGQTNIYSDVAYDSTTAWHHLALTRDGTTKVATLWVDGVAQAETTTHALDDSGGALTIGRWYADADVYYMDGNVDEVGIWNVVLDSGAMSDLYNSGAGVKANTVSSSAIVAYYDMECDGPGSTNLKDLSGNDLNGTLTNMSAGTCGAG